MKTKQKVKPNDTHKGIINCTQKEVKRASNVFYEKNGEKGITLVALIITVIILVILSAVGISTIYKSKIVDYAIEGAQKYAAEGVNENKVMEGTEQLIESAVNTIRDMGVTGGEINPNPTPDPKPEEGKPSEELGKTEYIGKYVNYIPAGSDYTISGTYSGTNSDQTFSANNNMKWRIWGVEGNKLLLISESLAENIMLNKEEGYNNGVKILNNACSTAFGNSSTYGLGTINARSINQEDIDKVTNMTTDAQRKAAYSKYETTITASANAIRWPNIYGEELSKTGGGSLARSSQISWYSGTTAESFIAKYTYYGYKIETYAMNTMYDALLTNPVEDSATGSTSNTTYWVASRCTHFYESGIVEFDMFRVSDGNVNPMDLYSSNSGGRLYPDFAVRPMVEVDLSKVNIGITGSGTSSNPYSMAKK